MSIHSSIINNKKIIVFIFLLFFGASLILPQIAKAEGMTGAEFGENWLETPTETNPNDCTSNLGTLDSVTVAIPNAILWGTKEIAGWTTTLSSLVIGMVLSWPITNTSTSDAGALAFAAGWTSTRDLANMLVVLGFVIVGIATALRIREYEASKFLWLLIISAILINFSVLFCGLIIDGSNITMKGLATGTDIGTPIYTLASTIQGNSVCAALRADNIITVVKTDILFSCIYLAIAFAFLYLSIILLARYAILGILFMLSPLAFVFYAFPFPKAKDLWNEWWKEFLKWAFIGVSLCFFINMATKMFTNYQDIMATATAENLGNYIFYLAVILMVIIVGIKISTKQSGVGALASAAIIGVATGGAGLAMGVAGKVGGGGAKALDKLSGGAGSAAAQKVSSAAGRGLERIGLRQTGVTAETNKQRVEKEAAPLVSAYAAAKATGDTATVDRIQKQAKQGRGAAGAAAMKVVSDAKDLHKAFADSSKPGGVDLAKAAERATYAESAGATGVIKNSENTMPKLARYNEVSKKEISSKNPTWTPAQIEREAERKKTSEMGVADMRNMPAPQMDADFFEMANPQTLKRAGLEFNGDQRAVSKTALPELRDRRNQELITAHVAAGGPAFTGPNTTANRDAYYQANLSTDALSNKYKAMAPAAQAAWGTALSASEKKIYDEAGGMANADRAYVAIERNKMDIASGGRVGTLENSIKAIKAINT